MSRFPVRLRRRPTLLNAVALTATAAAVIGVPALATSASAAPTAAAHPQVSTVNPGAGPESITGPIPSEGQPGDPAHDYVFYSTPFDLKKAGYEELEYFISGTATRYPSNP